MARPRIHDPDEVLDTTEQLIAQSGPAAVTIRAIATATGVSNGALYHSFGSRYGLVGQTWIRAARRFLEVQAELVDAGLSADGGAYAAIRAVVAAADAPAEFAERFPASSVILHALRKSDLLGDDLPEDMAEEISSLERQLIGLMIRLSVAMWDRNDAAAVDVITTCVVDLPTSILLTRERLGKPTAREHLRAAVHAVLSVGPPPV